MSVLPTVKLANNSLASFGSPTYPVLPVLKQIANGSDLADKHCLVPHFVTNKIPEQIFNAAYCSKFSDLQQPLLQICISDKNMTPEWKMSQ